MKNNKEFKKTYLYKLNILLLSFLLTFSNVLSDGTLFVSAEGEEEVPQETTEVIPEETPEVTPEVTPEPTEVPVETEVPTPTPTEVPVETPLPTETPEVIETPEPTEEPTVEVVGVPFEQKKVVDDVEITVSAEAGVFPEGSTLSVTKVPYYVKKQVTEAIDQVRDEEKTVAVSYTFDIKILKDGTEVQPKDMNKVKVSFKMVEVQNENLTTEVYHIDDSQKKITSDNVTALETITEEDVATVETEGFSIYTVEFTYDKKQFVLEGGSYIKLEEVLSSIGLNGEVTSYKVSDKTLFDVVLSDGDGIEFVEVYAPDSSLEEYYPIDKENGTILYLVSLQPFTSEEWLKVTIDNIEYTIVVTDAIRIDEDGNEYTNVRYMQQSTTIGTITDNRVIQGPLEDNFTASMPLAEIYINDVLVNQEMWKNGKTGTEIRPGVDVIAKLLVDETQDNGKYRAFVLNTDVNRNNGDMKRFDDNYGGLVYDFSKRGLNGVDGSASSLWPSLNITGSNINNYELFSGPIVEYTLKGMAIKFDPTTNNYKNYDVVITYSDILITMCKNGENDTTPIIQNNNNLKNRKLNIVDTNCVYVGWNGGTDGPFRAGMSYKVNVKVVDPDSGSLVEGSYYYPMTDIDIGRSGVGGFKNLYNAANVNRYSEQIALLNNYGRPTSTGSWEQKVWIPGGNYSAAPYTSKGAVTEDTFPYTCKITSMNVDGQANTLLITPGGTTTAVTGSINSASGINKDNSFYSGFITLANNTAGGINVRGWGAAPLSGGVESYVLTGSKIVNHKVDASSDVGGTIFTTTTGNSDGSLSGGTLLGRDAVNQPFELSAATGQSVTYTMTPKGGYKLKRVWVKDNDIDIMSIINAAKATVDPSQYDLDDETQKAAYEAAVQTAIDNALASDTTHTSEIPISSLTSLGKGVYSYTFSKIAEDKSVHIDWEKTDLTVTKKLDPTMTGISEKFKFQIKLTDTSTQDTTWRVRAKKNTGLFEWNMGVEDGTPYYMAYYEWKDETVPYKYVEVTDTTDKNPSEEGWYYYVDGAYYLSTDTEPKPEVTYYIKDETQTSTITIYRYHILGWNEATQTWDNREITGGYDIMSGSNLGAVNLDTELSDNYRFVSDGNYVYNTASYNTATESYDEYLMWIYDDASDEYVLVSGNSETYPQGTTFSPTTSAPDFLYVFRDGVENYSNKVIRTDTSRTIDGETYPRNGAENKYVFKQDANTPIYYNLITNPNGYDLDSGYTEVQGESGVYIVTLPAGQNPKTEDLAADGWDVTVSRVGAIPDSFDLEKAMRDAGAKPVQGTVNTFEFELGVDETIDFNGVVPMGYKYEITEILPQTSRWELKSKSTNASVNDFDGEEDVTFTNTEKKHAITIEKETVNNVEGTFKFKVKFWKEQATSSQNGITVNAKFVKIGSTQPVTLPSDSTAYNYYSSDKLTYKLYKSDDINTVVEESSVFPGTGWTYDENTNSFSYMFSNVKEGESYIVQAPKKNIDVDINDGDDDTNDTRTIYYPYNRDTYEDDYLKNASVNDTVSFTHEVDGINVMAVPNNGIASLLSSLFNITSVSAEGETTTNIPYDPDSTDLPTGCSISKTAAGEYTFTLTNGQSVNFKNLPHGVHYEVYEVDANGNEVSVGSNIGDTNWKLISINGANEGVLEENIEVTFTNEKYYQLTVQKETVDNDEGTFDFDIKLWKEVPITPIESSGVTFDSDEYAAYGISWSINLGIPDNGEYTITTYSPSPLSCEVAFSDSTEHSKVTRVSEEEASPGKYKSVWKLNNVFGGGTFEFVFQNRNAVPTTTTEDDFVVEVEKKITYFDLSAIAKPITDEDGDGKADDGKYKFSLTVPDKPSLVIKDIPYGYQYEVFELDKNGNEVKTAGTDIGEGWKLIEFTDNEGKLTDNDKIAKFKNKLSKFDITVEKEVTGAAGDKEKEFEFEVKVWKETTSTNPTYTPVMYYYDNQNDNITIGLENYFDTPITILGYAGDNVLGDNPEITIAPGGAIKGSNSSDGYEPSQYYDFIMWFATQMPGFSYHHALAPGENEQEVLSNLNWGGYEKVKTTALIDGVERELYIHLDANSEAAWAWYSEYSADIYALINEEVVKNNYYDLSEAGGTPKVDENNDGIADDGIYIFKLKHGENFKLEKIPYGYQYEVIEDDYSSESYKTTVDEVEGRNASGTVIDHDITHKYVNDKDYVDLTIKKTVSGNMGNKYKDFEFEVRIGGWKTAIRDKISKWWGEGYGMQADFSENHSQDITELGALLNDSLRMRVVVNGVERVPEEADDFSGLQYANNIIEGSGLKITPEFVLFKSGASGEGMYLDPGDVIELQYYEYLDLTEYGGVPKVDEDEDGIADDGVYIFKLKHGEKIDLSKLPGGYQYEVKEKDYSGVGYITTVDGKPGRTASGKLMNNTEHEYENNLSAVIPTKAFGGMITPMIGLMMIAIFWFIMDYRKKKKILDEELDE